MATQLIKSENEPNALLCSQIETSENLNDFSENLEIREASGWFIYITAFTANLLMVQLGCCMVWASPVLPKLISNDTNINPLEISATTVQLSVIAASPFFALTIGFVVIAKISDSVGRKKTMALSAVCLIVALISIAFAQHIYMYYGLLLLMGFGMSGVFLSVPIYIGEIAERSNREKLGCFTGFGMPLGSLVAFACGPLTSIKIFSIICALPALIYLILSCFIIVESPVYLVSKNKTTEALKTLTYLRRKKHINEIKIEYRNIEKLKKVENTIHKATIWDLFRNRASKKALFLSATLCVGQQTTGINTIITFTGLIFFEADSSLSGDTVGIIIGVAQVLIIFIAFNVVDKLGRKRLLLCSALVCALTMFLNSYYFYLRDTNSLIAHNIRWLPIISVILYIIGYGLGLGPIPPTLVGELFEANIRSFGVAIILVVESLTVLAIRFSFPLLSEAFGIYCCMLFHGVAALLVFIILYLSLPETKGKNLNEIQYVLSQ